MVWFLSVSTDMTDGIEKWKRSVLSTQNGLALKKKEVNCPVGFAVSLAIELHFGWMT